MANMTIKRWDTSENNNQGGWVEQYPKTVTTQLYDSSGDAVFEQIGNEDKIKAEYLPNSVFDSLKFSSSFDASISSNKQAIFIDKLKGIYDNAATNDRSAIGYYLVFSDGGTLAQANTDTAGYLGTSFYGQYTYKHDDSSSSAATSVTVEAGDWAVIESASGTGASDDPFIVTLSIISNTYELYQGATNVAAGSPGLVPAASSLNRFKFLRGDGTYETPTNTFRTISVDTDGDGSADNTLETTETLVIKKGTNVDVSEVGGVVTIGVSNESIEEVVGGMVDSNSVSGITVTYTDNGNGPGKLDFSVPVMEGATLTEGGAAGLVPQQSVSDHTKYLQGSGDFTTPARRIIKINGATTPEISASSNDAADFIDGVGINVSATSGTGTVAGEIQFKMEYPIAVNDTENNVSDYEVPNGIWFDIS